MASVFDVAASILDKTPSVSHMKLQKLVYYAQAWSLVWDDEPLFPEKIEAWVNGPVVPQLFAVLQGSFKADRHKLGDADPDRLGPPQKDTIDKVLEFYGHRDAQWLSDLSHGEGPWREARKGLLPNERGSREITHALMAEYYGGL